MTLKSRTLVSILSASLLLLFSACSSSPDNTTVAQSEEPVAQPDSMPTTPLADSAAQPAVAAQPEVAAQPVVAAQPEVVAQSAELVDTAVQPETPIEKIDIAENSLQSEASAPKDEGVTDESVLQDQNMAIVDPEPQSESQPQTEPTTHDVQANDNSRTISEDLSPLSDAMRAKLASITWDMEPEVLNAVLKENEGGHFPWSDELHPEKFYDSIKNLGGTYIGVGTDQAYVFIGWQRPTLAFAVDYDPWAVYIHHGYLALFDTCEDMTCFRKMLTDRDETYKFLLNEYYADHPDRKQIAKIFKTNAHGLLRQMNRIAKYPYPTFANDQATYDYIRTLVKTGRLRTLQANLLGDTALKSISQTLRETGRTITTLYTSNAEQYWNYNKAFKENMRAIPWADNGVLMRTLATKPMNQDYTYRIMPHKVFLAWLDDSRGTNVKRISQRFRFKPRPEGTTEPFEVPFILDDIMPQDSDVK